MVRRYGPLQIKSLGIPLEKLQPFEFSVAKQMQMSKCACCYLPRHSLEHATSLCEIL